MSALYPNEVRTFVNPLSTDYQDVVSHSSQHTFANDEINAIETTLGTAVQGTFSDLRTRLDAIGTGVSANATYISALSYGTTYTGTEIQQALNVAGSAGGGIAFVPHGTWTITAQLTIPSNTTLQGEGVSSIIKVGTSGFNPIMKNQTGAVNVGINNIHIVGGSVVAEAITITASSNPVIMNNYIQDCWGGGCSIHQSDYAVFAYNYETGNKGIALALGASGVDPGGTPSRYAVVIGNRVINHIGDDGFYIDLGSSYAKVIGNELNGIERYGIVLDSGSGSATQYCNIIGNKINSKSYAITVLGSTPTTGNRFIGNYITTTNNDAHCIYAQSGNGSNSYIDNIIYPGSAFALQTAVGADGNIITGNTVIGAPEHGFEINSKYNLISSNMFNGVGTLTDNTYTAILFVGTTAFNNIASNNVVVGTTTNNPAYGIREEGTGPDYNLIIGNQIKSAQTAGISTSGGSTVAANNISAA